jgi:hypothetical protein
MYRLNGYLKSCILSRAKYRYQGDTLQCTHLAGGRAPRADAPRRGPRVTGARRRAWLKDVAGLDREELPDGEAVGTVRRQQDFVCGFRFILGMDQKTDLLPERRFHRDLIGGVKP